MLPNNDLETLQAYLDGTLTPAETALVETRLLNETALADALLRLSREETVLREWAAASLHATACLEQAQPIVPISAGTVRRPAGAWIRNMRRLAQIAAALLIVAMLLARPRGLPPVTDGLELAQIEDIQGEVYVLTDAGEVQAEPGQTLFAGQGVATAGEGSSAIVRYGDATRLNLAGDTKILLIGERRGKKIEVAQGTGDVTGLPQGKPITLSTPHLSVMSVGGAFSFASDPGSGTRVQSDSGKVEITRKCDGKSVTVNSGQYAFATLAADPMQPRAVPARRWLVNDIVAAPHCLAFARDGQALITSTGKGQLRVCAVATGDTEQLLEKHRRRVNALAVSADGHTLISAADDATVFLWDLASGKERQIARGLKARITALAFASSGRMVVAGCDDKMIRFIDVETGEERVVLKGHRGRINAVTLSPNERYLVSAGGLDKESPELILWDARTGQERRIAELSGHEREVLAVAFAPDESVFATAARDNTVRLWDAATGAAVRTLRGHSAAVAAVAFSPDGSALASSACDGTVRLWATASGDEFLSFKAHKGCIQSVAFSPDAHYLATLGSDKALAVWDLTTTRAEQN